MHLDLYSDSTPAVERLVGLAAVRAREVHDPDDAYVVLLDPEGNEFSVCSVDEVSAPDR